MAPEIPPVIIYPPIIIGVVPGGNTPIGFPTIPNCIDKYVIITVMIGINKNGIHIIGLKTIGNPNNTGSFILKILGARLNLPNFLYC